MDAVNGLEVQNHNLNDAKGATELIAKLNTLCDEIKRIDSSLHKPDEMSPMEAVTGIK